MSPAEDLYWTASAMALAVLLAGLSVGIETSLVGLPAARVQAAVGAKVRGARHLLFWLQRPSEVLASLHLLRSGLTLCLGVLVWQAVVAFALSWQGASVAVLLTLLALNGSQLIWRTVAKRFVVEMATRTMWLVAGLTMGLLPVVRPLGWLSRLMARLFVVPKVPLESIDTYWTPDEIGHLTSAARAAHLGERGADLFLTLSEFSGTVIREIMVPRTEMVTLAQSASRAEVQQLVLSAGHSRLPVYDDTIDNIVGVLHVKDLFVAQLQAQQSEQPTELNLAAMVRPTFYVPEVMKISELLRDFQRRKTHLAIVVDEYGGTAGVVTLEDIIEEIVGEIQDEYDVEEKQFRVLGDKIIADGRVSIWDLEEALGVDFPDDADYETLAGFLMSRTGSLPEPGMVIRWGQHRFTIKEADAKRVRTVEIDKQL